MQRYLIIGLEQRKALPPLEGTEPQSMSVAFARQLYKAVMKSTADTRTYIKFRDRLFKGENRLFDFIDLGKEGQPVSEKNITGLHSAIAKSSNIILLGKQVAERIPNKIIPPTRRIEMGFPSWTKDKKQARILLRSILSDPNTAELVISIIRDLN